MRYIMPLLVVVLVLLAACGKSDTAQSRTPEQLGETMLRALESEDFPRLQETFTDAETYQSYCNEMTARFHHEVNPGFKSESYPGRIAETRTAFERIRTTSAERFGFDWSAAVLVTVSLSEHITELEGFTDHSGMDILFRANDTDYRISTYGAVRTADGELLLKPGRFWLVKQ
ncbi:MAG: hypothetical protein K8R90_03680 [Candidatus Cloacimonetes bacterium]|nr:hypothetical protein [Candidatus Cloacimonadota bacterium]